MARRVEEYDISVFEGNFFDAYVDGNASSSFLLCLVGDPGKFEGLFAHFFGLFLVFMHLLFGNFVNQVHELTYKCGFA